MQRATAKLGDHFGSDQKAPRETHKTARQRAVDFLAIMENKTMDVLTHIDNRRSQNIERNREVLKSLVDIVVLCGRQNLALRGHRDDAKDIGVVGHNPGNFHVLVNFAIANGNTILKDYIANAPKNCQYRSKTIQNEIIGVLKDYITDNIIAEVKKAKYFSISADEKADRSNEEQLSMCLRYVDSSCKVHESFIGFVDVTGKTTGSELASCIKDTVTSLGIDFENCVGQTYDGAGNMAGIRNGAAALIRGEFPRAAYTHCASHCLNLCLSKSASTPTIRNMIDTTEKIVLFYNYSPKRNLNLQKWVAEKLPNSSKTKLLDTCTTRFIQRHDAMETFATLYPAIEASMEEMSTSAGYNRDTSSDATSYLNAITNYQFMITMIIVKNCLLYTKGLSVSLQSRTDDIIRAYTSVQNVIDTVSTVRDDIGTRFHDWYLEANALANILGVEPSIPRRCAKQTNRANTPADSAEDYYRRTVAIPYLDDLIAQLHDRFKGIIQSVIKCMYLVPNMLDKSPDMKTLLSDFVSLYQDDLSDLVVVNVELDLWINMWKHRSEKERPSTASAALLSCNSMEFPNIHKILRIMCTFGVTSCECERSNSELGLLKSYLRATMGQDRMNGLALLHVHYGLNIDINDIVDRFARKHHRRLVLNNVFVD